MLPVLSNSYLVVQRNETLQIVTVLGRLFPLNPYKPQQTHYNKIQALQQDVYFKGRTV